VQGVPFSEAHEITGALVKACEARGLELEQVDAALLAQVDPRLTAEVLPHLSLDAAVTARTGQGGTAPMRVAEQMERLRALLTQQAQWAEHYGGPQC
jgi:argininosuccinate lyase